MQTDKGIITSVRGSDTQKGQTSYDTQVCQWNYKIHEDKVFTKIIKDISCYQVPTLILSQNLKRSTSVLSSPQQKIFLFCFEGLSESHRNLQNRLLFRKQICYMPLIHRTLTFFIIICCKLIKKYLISKPNQLNLLKEIIQQY